MIDRRAPGTATGKLFPGVILTPLHFDVPEYALPGGEGDFTILLCVEGCLHYRAEAKAPTLHPGSFAMLSNGNGGLLLKSPQECFHGLCIRIQCAVADAWANCSMGIFAPTFAGVRDRLLSCGADTALSAGVQGEHILRELYESSQRDKQLIVRLKLTELFLQLQRLPILAQEEVYLPKSQQQLVRHLRDHILTDDGYTSLQQLAQDHGLSVSSLQKSFKAVYGMPVYQYLRSYRLERAAVGLKTTDRSITDLAMEAGYTNPSKFTESFQRQFGMTPSAYRRSQKHLG